jgi:hypothetical protein
MRSPSIFKISIRKEETMIFNSFKHAVLIGLVALATSTLDHAHAAWGGATSGHNSLTCQTSVLGLDENHSLMTVRAKGLVVTTPNSPDHMAHVECLGTVESMADKSFKASGYCVLTDRDGDKWLDRWWADSTMPKGRWEDSGISGKYLNLRRSGTYVYTDRSIGSACEGMSSWEVDR